jgi:hypothetical protein
MLGFSASAFHIIAHSNKQTINKQKAIIMTETPVADTPNVVDIKSAHPKAANPDSNLGLGPTPRVALSLTTMASILQFLAQANNGDPALTAEAAFGRSQVLFLMAGQLAVDTDEQTAVHDQAMDKLQRLLIARDGIDTVLWSLEGLDGRTIARLLATVEQLAMLLLQPLGALALTQSAKAASLLIVPINAIQINDAFTTLEAGQ